MIAAAEDVDAERRAELDDAATERLAGLEDFLYGRRFREFPGDVRVFAVYCEAQAAADAENHCVLNRRQIPHVTPKIREQRLEGCRVLRDSRLGACGRRYGDEGDEDDEARTMLTPLPWYGAAHELSMTIGRQALPGGG